MIIAIILDITYTDGEWIIPFHMTINLRDKLEYSNRIIEGKKIFSIYHGDNLH